MDNPATIDRRSALKTLGALGIAQTLSSATVTGQGRKADGFALVGASTPFEVVRDALDANIVKGMGITLDFTGDPKQMTSLDGYKLLVTLHYGPFSPEQEVMVQNFVKNGGGALFLHNSTDISRRGTGILRDVMGGYWLRHTDIRPYRTRITNRNHPITKGVNDFETTGEHHYNQYDKDPRHVFLVNESIDGWSYNNIEGDIHYDSQVGNLGFGPSGAAGWAYDYGNGRICFMAPGHTFDELVHPEYVKLQQNAVRWVLKQV